MVVKLLVVLFCSLLNHNVFAIAQEDPTTFVKLAAYTPQTDADQIDTLVFIEDGIMVPQAIAQKFPELQTQLNRVQAVDATFKTKASVHVVTKPTTPGLPKYSRLIYSPTISMDHDVVDSRTFYEAATDGLKLAHKAGAQKIVLVVGDFPGAPATEPWSNPKDILLTTILGALYALYMPLETRECCPQKASKYQKLYISSDAAFLKETIQHAKAIEEGRWVARDICGSDPERMSTSKILEYLKDPVYFPKEVSYREIPIDEKNYPLLHAVNRASKAISRHDGRVVRLELPAVSATKNVLYFIGKGVTYDTGGLDLRVNDDMVGMHRRKCGAAAVVGFLKTASMYADRDFKVVAKLAFVRNNIGAQSYSIDEILKSRSGKRIRIGDTAASGNMVLPDLITETIEEVHTQGGSINATIFAVATMTNHVYRTYKWITGAMQNGPTMKAGLLESIRLAGERTGDLLEISALRKEDFASSRYVLETEDLLQCSPNCVSSGTSRGHQIPAAFIIQASGLDQHGLDKPPGDQIKFIHMDVTGSAGLINTVPTASPMTMLARHYLIR